MEKRGRSQRGPCGVIRDATFSDLVLGSATVIETVT